MQKKPIITRRAFIRLTLLGGIGAGLAYMQHRTADLGMLNFIRWSFRGQLQRIRRPTTVGLAKCASYEEDLVQILHDLWNISDMPDVSGKSILVKPNLLNEVDNNLATTPPRVVGAILEMLEKLGASKVVVADGSAFQRDTYSVVKICGLKKELDAREIPFIDLNYDELVPVRTRDGWFRNNDILWLPRP